jgi:hypothetical protein
MTTIEFDDAELEQLLSEPEKIVSFLAQKIQAARKQAPKESAQKQFFRSMKKLFGQSNVLTVPRVLIDLMDGDIQAALFLGQCIYWSDKGRDGEWFYKSFTEWRDEIGLSRRQVRRILPIISKWVDTKIETVNRSRTMHYHVNIEALIEAINLKSLENDAVDTGTHASPSHEDTCVPVTRGHMRPCDTGSHASPCGNTRIDYNTDQNKDNTQRSAAADDAHARPGDDESESDPLDAAAAESPISDFLINTVGILALTSVKRMVAVIGRKRYTMDELALLWQELEKRTNVTNKPGLFITMVTSGQIPKSKKQVSWEQLEAGAPL